MGEWINILYRSRWNIRIFPFTKKSYLHHAQWRYYFFLSRVRILVSPWLLTWLAKIFLFFIRIRLFGTEMYFSFITLYPSFRTFLWQAFAIGDHFNCTILLFEKWIEKSCVLCRNFICIYKITEHYMATWGYKFYLLVLKVSLTRSLRSLMRDTFSTGRWNSYPRAAM